MKDMDKKRAVLQNIIDFMHSEEVHGLKSRKAKPAADPAPAEAAEPTPDKEPDEGDDALEMLRQKLSGKGKK